MNGAIEKINIIITTTLVAVSSIGVYAEWISSHPEVLGLVLPLMLQGLREPELAQSATLSLKEVLSVNQDHLQPFVADILNASKVLVVVWG